MKTWLSDFATSLQHAGDSAAVWTETRAFFRRLGIDNLNYSYGWLHDRPTFFTTTPDAFMERYYRERWFEVDPGAEHILNGNRRPFFQGPDYRECLPGSLSRDTSRVDELLEEIVSVGLRSNLLVPYLGAAPGDIGALNLGIDHGRRQADAFFSEHLEIFHLAAMLCHARFMSVQPDPTARVDSPLSEREAECLKWVATGLRTDRIAERLGLSNVTVEVCLGSAKRKLGASTRSHALALAIVRGLIDP